MLLFIKGIDQLQSNPPVLPSIKGHYPNPTEVHQYMIILPCWRERVGGKRERE